MKNQRKFFVPTLQVGQITWAGCRPNRVDGESVPLLHSAFGSSDITEEDIVLSSESKFNFKLKISRNYCNSALLRALFILHSQGGHFPGEGPYYSIYDDVNFIQNNLG